MIEPELIEIIEGPTPDFQASPQDWPYSVQEGPGMREVALTQLRTMSGQDIIERCERAWSEGRPVMLDFPDDMRLRQQVNVVALRLSEVDEGQMLLVWVALPIELDLLNDEYDDDEFDDDEFDDDEFDEDEFDEDEYDEGDENWRSLG